MSERKHSADTTATATSREARTIIADTSPDRNLMEEHNMSPRRPLEVLLNQPQPNNPIATPRTSFSSADALSSSEDYADMPSLSSYRSDEKSSVGSAKVDCDSSLPSLSSFRIEDLSTTSSYHSRGSAATNHLSNFSEESVEGWASFTGGNISKSDTDSVGVEDDDEDEDGNDQSQRAVVASKSTQLTSAVGEEVGPIVKKSPGHHPSLKSTAFNEHGSVAMKPPQRRRSRSDSTEGHIMGGPPDASAQRTVERATATKMEVSLATTARDMGSVSIKPSIERNESMPLTELQRPALVIDQGSSSSIRMEGSSSSIKGDSLPKLPRRTSTVDDGSDHESGRRNSPGEIMTLESNTRGSEAVRFDDENSDTSSEGGLSLEMDNDEESDDCSVQTDMDEDNMLDPSKSVSKTMLGSEATCQLHVDGQHEFSLRASDNMNETTSPIRTRAESCTPSGTRSNHSERRGNLEQEVNKKGNLIRRMSSTLKRVGRSASFRMTGRKASSETKQTGRTTAEF